MHHGFGSGLGFYHNRPDHRPDADSFEKLDSQIVRPYLSFPSAGISSCNEKKRSIDE